jgi:tetraacyldisaccharide 4'-kinase
MFPLARYMPYEDQEGGTPISAAVSAALAPAGAVYSSVMVLRRLAYKKGILKTGRPPCRVVSVGNISAGGTGKTQVVSFLASKAAEAGLAPAIVGGGYGGAARELGLTALVDDGTKADFCGDEARMLHGLNRGVPVFVSRDRHAGCLAAFQAGARLCILDDAAQHLSVARDLDVMVLDPGSPFGNGRCIPAGPLREPPSALKNAGLIWLAGNGENPPFSRAELAARRINRSAPFIWSVTRPSGIRVVRAGCEPTVIDPAGVAVFAVSGIARPSRFHGTLVLSGAVVAGRSSFGDHHRFTAEDAERIKRSAERSGASLAVITSKDEARSGDVLGSVLGTYGVLMTRVEIVSGGENMAGMLKG